MANQETIARAIQDITVCANMIERATERMDRAAKMDAPPTLYMGEAKLIRHRLADLRAHLALLDALSDQRSFETAS